MVHLQSVALTLVSIVAAASCWPNYLFPDAWPNDDLDDLLLSHALDEAQGPKQAIHFDTDGQHMGMVTGLDVDDQGHVVVFHRANRKWTAETFNATTNVLSEPFKIPISEDTIFVLNPDTGRKIQSFGANIFNVPHGLTIDHDNNIWVTDVGRHQVLRIPNGFTEPDLEVGVKFQPGSDNEHFCKPTAVAVASNGDFFVADGYCNSRILKFNKHGKHIKTWGRPNEDGNQGPPGHYNLNVPHSLALIEEQDLICVADRDNGRSLCYDAGINSKERLGQFNSILIDQGLSPQIFAIYYNKAGQNVIAAFNNGMVPVEIPRGLFYPYRAATVELDSKKLTCWARLNARTSYGPNDSVRKSLTHDICSSKNGRHFYLGDLIQQRVFKYSLPSDD